MLTRVSWTGLKAPSSSILSIISVLPILPVLFILLTGLLFTGCSEGAAQTNNAPPDLDVQLRESPEPSELNPADLLVVHFIDVGEGDAILVVQGNYAMLVDGGPDEMGAVVFSYLRSQGIAALDYVVATHPFADHVGGLPDVLRRVPVRNVLLPMIYHDTPAFNNLLLAVEDSGADVAIPFAGDTFALGDAIINILAPNPTDQWDNRANYSIVMRIEFGTTSFLLMGDAMREVEANLLDSAMHLSSDVLKVARHGASSATTSGFLDAVNPSIAVISAGGGNSFLAQETLLRLSNVGAHFFRTDLNGNIIITSDGTTLRVTIENFESR
jgi:beta-lactamase superfamily II metal-dependent hydrolase